jgi:predicted RNA binding protein YcfA (HicA-like mRNA interferase family)
MTPSSVPSLTAREIVRKLKKAGCVVARQKGSHVVLIRKTDKRAVVIPMHVKKDVPKGTLHRIIELAGLTPEEFNEL